MEYECFSHCNLKKILVEPFKLLIFKMIPATVAVQLHQKRERVILGFMGVLIFLRRTVGQISLLPGASQHP